MMIDFVSPDFWPIIPLVPHCGTSHFIRRFVDPHRSARSLSLTGCSLRCGHGRYLTKPLRSIQLVSHFSTLGCHHASPSGRSSWIYVHDSVMDSDDHCYMFDDRWFHVARFLTCRASDAHTGAYFPFRMRFTDFHGGRMCDHGWFHDICSSDLSRTWCHTGAYSVSEDLYGSL